MIKTANQKLGNILNLIKKHTQKPAVNILFNGETLSFLTKIRWKERMILITTSFQYYTGRLRECNKTRKGKLYLLADDMTVYVEYMKELVKLFLATLSDYVKDD